MDGDDQNEDPPVGYCSPPRSSQFKPGKSGNPAGRPRGSKKLKTGNVMLQAASKLFDEKLPSVKRGKPVQIPLVEALSHALVKKAATGDPKSLRFLLARQAADEKRRKAAKAVVSGGQAAGFLVVPAAPSSIQGWMGRYSDKASGQWARRRQESGEAQEELGVIRALDKCV